MLRGECDTGSSSSIQTNKRLSVTLFIIEKIPIKWVRASTPSGVGELDGLWKNFFEAYVEIGINQQKKGKQMSTVSARPARIEDLPVIVGLLSDDVLGKGRENIGPPLHSDYLDAFEAINDDPNQVFVVFEAESIIIGCLQLSFILTVSARGMARPNRECSHIF